MNDEVKLVIAVLAVFGGAVWFVQTWVRMRHHQREADQPINGYWGRVAAREMVRRTRAELCAALLVVMIGVLLGVNVLG